MPDQTAAVLRRLAAFGAITRMTGDVDVVTVDGDALVVNDEGGDLRLRYPGGGDEAPEQELLWITDESAQREVVGWVEDYLDDTAMEITIRRDDLDDLVADPFSPRTVQRLIWHFPGADADGIADFLATVRTLG
ncbi:MAG: hypothetical protein QM728_00190 [Gordonia sp. (in: high G+C Gram-positive bacteria)]|uniref:hypothetical protein n=1 Tax=Gordonia sp. (in: high G+C Gram-positive bacteria) TaxID=84139 RepID=UPI0039E3D8FB